jgi:hypothetical protein
MGRRKVKGLIGSAGLAEWWFATFNDRERNLIDELFAKRERERGPGVVLFSVRVSASDNEDGFDVSTDANSPDDRNDEDPIASLTEDTPNVWREEKPGSLIASLVRLLRKSHPALSRRCLEKLESMEAVVELHFLYGDEIGYGLERVDDPKERARRAAACERQIGIAPRVVAAMLSTSKKLPWHRGYEELARLRKAEGRFAEATRLATEALEQGWSGCWEEIIGDGKQMSLF